MLDLTAIKLREARATKPPWIACDGPMCNVPRHAGINSYGHAASGNVYRVRRVELKGGTAYDTADVIAPNTLYREDAEFIAHAREDIPALIAEVERLRAQLKGEKQGP